MAPPTEQNCGIYAIYNMVSKSYVYTRGLAYPVPTHQEALEHQRLLVATPAIGVSPL